MRPPILSAEIRFSTSSPRFGAPQRPLKALQNRSTCDHNLIAFVFHTQAQYIACKARKGFNTGCRKCSVDGELCYRRIRDDQLLPVVAVEFGGGGSKRCLVENQHAM